MNDPCLFKAVLADVLGNGGSLLLQPACQQVHETAAEPVAHGSHGKEERRTSAAVNLMPYAIRVNAPTRHDAVNVWVVEQVRAPRVENGCHASVKPLPVGKRINGGQCGLEHTVIEDSLMSHSNRIQTCRQREYDMEVPGRDNLLPAELYPLLTLLVLTLGAMTIPTAVIADADIPALGAHFYMPSKGTGTALGHVSKSSSDCRYDLMLRKELISMDSDNLADVESCPHLGFGGKMVSISRTCFIGSMSAT